MSDNLFLTSIATYCFVLANDDLAALHDAYQNALSVPTDANPFSPNAPAYLAIR